MAKSTLRDMFCNVAKVTSAVGGTALVLGSAWLLKDFAIDPAIPAKALAIPATGGAIGAFYGLAGAIPLVRDHLASRANQSAQPS